MTSGNSAFQREDSPEARSESRATTHGAQGSPPMLTWIGPMEVMMGGARYRLVPSEAAANHTGGAATPHRGDLEPLTPREAQVARLVADGLVNKEIGRRLAISEWTVNTHLRHIFAKLEVETRAAMVLRCFGARP